eukprot:TRINITY_DN3952_c0_g1_i1.p1 TRINITY_DN3952_c0_g1~~TRINITY_DN3952_c0_g1_i1.p1  ORF type:complete len:346 (+),score=47.90 TRINITY_DN3952_c0_g1_i1:98-1135(+)
MSPPRERARSRCSPGRRRALASERLLLALVARGAAAESPEAPMQLLDSYRLNVFGEPLAPCGLDPGSGVGDYCTPRRFDPGAHMVCVPSLPGSFSVDTGQGTWSSGFVGRSWCICVWAFLYHHARVTPPVEIDCRGIPLEALETAARENANGAVELMRTCLVQAPSASAAAYLESSVRQLPDDLHLGKRRSFILQVYLIVLGMLLATMIVALYAGCAGRPDAWHGAQACARSLAADALRRIGISSAVVGGGPAEGPCRICHGDESCVSVCRCKGSLAGVHLACLEQWRRARGSVSSCEICREPYRLRWSACALALARSAALAAASLLLAHFVARTCRHQPLKEEL